MQARRSVCRSLIMSVLQLHTLFCSSTPCFAALHPDLQLHTLFCTSTPCFAAPHPVLQFYTLFCISTPWSTGYRWSFRSYHFLMLHLVDVACLGVNAGKGGEGAWAELEKIRSKLLPISSLKTPKTL